MISDNLKTWPERIYLYGNPELTYENQTGKLGWSEDNFAENIKYIRADIAKERETKLIAAALYLGEDWVPVGKENMVYVEAGLQELK